MGLKIHVLARDGSPLGVTSKSIWGEDGRMGVGGAELGILTLLEGLYRRGDDVIFYNDPEVPNGSIFPQRNIGEFNPSEDRDVLIIFRSPNPSSYDAKGYKVWLSNDQYTIDNYREFAGRVQKIVTISRFHSEYFEKTYGIINSIPIDIPIRIEDYRKQVEKVSKRCIFTSVPDRGLMQLNRAWTEINRQVPEASLTITSDWRLWTRYAQAEDTRAFQTAFYGFNNITYLGAVNRFMLLEQQLLAELHLYPCIYDELFCISVAESQVAGAYPITSNKGALGTTNMGMVISGEPTDFAWIDIFIQRTIEQLNNPKLYENGQYLRQLAMKRFSLDTVLKTWDEKVFCHV